MLNIRVVCYEGASVRELSVGMLLAGKLLEAMPALDI